MALPDYVKRAKNTYNSKFDLIQLKLPKGTKDRIKKIIGEDGSMAAFCVDELLEVISGYEAATSYQQSEQMRHISDYEPEPIAEPQKEVSEPVEKAEGKPKKAEFKPITPEEAAELQALIDGKKAEEKRAKEKAEQEKKAREESEQAEKEAEIMRYAEKLRASKQDIADAQVAKKVRVILEDAELRVIVLDPDKKEYVIEQLGEDVYNAVILADKEQRRQESMLSSPNF